MNARELISVLQQMPSEAEIVTEGCDCFGDCASVELTEDGSIYLKRSPTTPPSPEEIAATNTLLRKVGLII